LQTVAQVVIDAANQLQSAVTREVMVWSFAGLLASAVGYGRLEIEFRDHKIDRAQLVWGMKPATSPPKTA
jgi:hypothetical protein